MAQRDPILLHAYPSDEESPRCWLLKSSRKPWLPSCSRSPGWRSRKARLLFYWVPPGPGNQVFWNCWPVSPNPMKEGILVDGSRCDRASARSTPYLDPVPGSHTWFPHLNVRENIGYGANDTTLFAQVIELLGLEHLLSLGGFGSQRWRAPTCCSGSRPDGPSSHPAFGRTL